MKKTLILIGAALLASGCTSLDLAGHAAYTMKHVKDKDGNLVCCDLAVQDGKEFSGRAVSVTKTGTAGFTVQIMEGESKAFQGQAVTAGAVTVFPSQLPVLPK